MFISILQNRLLIFSLALAVGVVTVMFVQLPCNSLLCREIQNTGHIFLFALMTLALMPLMRNRRAAKTRYWLVDYAIVCGGMVALGIITELGQVVTQREPDLNDMLRDGAGIAVGLGLYAFYDLSVPRLTRSHWILKTCLLGASLGVLAVCFYPMMNAAWSGLQRDRAFPVIADFGARWTRTFVWLNQASLEPAMTPAGLTATENGARYGAVRLILNPEAYAGISLFEPYPDWSGYQTLSLEVYSPHARPISVVLRIHDEQHDQTYADRFNRALTLRPGNNRIQILLRDVAQAPDQREMDMKRISNLMLFAEDIDEVICLYPSIIRLE